jgi:tetratricopeptide (TPR) repeat protein
MAGRSPTDRGATKAGARRTRRDRLTAARLEGAQLAVGHFLRATRVSQRLTQEQVAAMTRGSRWQLSRAAISAIERGQNFPGMEAMLALSNVLYVDPKELVERARLSSGVPIDLTDLSCDDLERKAGQLFWAGNFRQALSVYDAMMERLALESAGGAGVPAERIASLEVRRATTLKRAGAVLSAIATAERAIALSAEQPETQAQAYVVLAGLQAQRGNLPLASDAAERAIQLAERSTNERLQGWAWNVKAKALYLSRRFEEARDAYLEAHRLARSSGDTAHLTHTEGNVGMCWLELGDLSQAQERIERALELAREHRQPALEAAWLVELGKIALQRNVLDRAVERAEAALRIAKPREDYLTIFCSEWLKHLVLLRSHPDRPDTQRLRYLRRLYLHLDQHEGVEEIQQFKETALRSWTREGRTS